jgi:diguanylate cyclase (GGDEF)-like protein
VKTHIQTRIILAFTLLLLFIQIASLITINSVISSNTHQKIKADLLGGERIFNLLRESNNQQLTQSASIMSSDFAFRKAIATADYNTVISALNNHGARIKADVLLLAGLDRNIVAHTLTDENIGQLQFQESIGVAEEQGQAGAMVVLDGKLYQMVVVPVLAPLPIGWLIAGFKIDNKFVNNLHSVSSLNVSFLTKATPASTWQLLISSLPFPTASLIPSVLPNSTAQSVDIATFRMANEDYMTLTSNVQTQGSVHIVAVLQRSLQESLQPLRRLQMFLLLLSGISLIAVLLASYVIAKGISKPISALGILANRIRQGDYTQPAKIERDDEIGDLASAFNHMQDGLAKREARITELAYNDQLTGLPNRVLFHDRLDQAAKITSRAGHSFALLVLNLDRFKEVNTVLGHHIGDLLLREVSKRLSLVLTRDSDTFARLGGDEFAVLLSSCDTQGAMRVVRKILDTLDQPILLEDQEIVATGSIGIAMYPEHGEEINTLLRHADIAMRKAKANNSSYALFDMSYVEQTRQHLSLLAELRYAIERNEFMLYYQPKVEFATGNISHVEALVRWLHPTRGIVPPSQFIPYAEHTGYIKNITRWIIESALRQRKQWEDMQLLLTISINISARDLMNADLPHLFFELMAEYGASPDWLCLEITESAIMEDPKRALGILEELHQMGLSLSVDDFGTGYSSLAYLKKLPVSELKIDQSFIFHMVNDRDDATIVRSTIDLGHNMGLVVVAEGIENQATWEMLKDMGCDLAQGYHIAKPMPAEALHTWLEQVPWTVKKS